MKLGKERSSIIWSAAMSACLATTAGCGGGGGGGPVATGPASLKLGEAQISYTGSAKPFVASGSGSVTVTGMSGASYSNIAIVPNQTLDNLLIVGGAADLQTINPVTGVLSPSLTGLDPGFPITQCFTNDGHIVFTAYSPSGGNAFAYECNYDGSGLKKINNSNPTFEIAWAPNNNLIAWTDPSYNLWVSSPNGANPVKISSNYCFVPSFSPNSEGVVFDYEAIEGGNDLIYFSSVSGGGATPLPLQDSEDNYFYPVWCPDSAALLCTFDNGSQRYLDEFNLAGNLIGTVNQPSSIMDQEQASIAPDGKTIAFDFGSTYEADPLNLAVSSVSGNDPSTIYSNALTTFSFPQWSPYPGPQDFVGSAGSMFGSASGFLWGQNGDVMTGFAAFTTTAPNSTTITPETANGSNDLIYDVHSSSITGLKYTTGYYCQIVNAYSNIPSGSTDVLVSFNSQTGQIGTIAPFIQSRAAVKPTRRGSGLSFQANFLAVFNAKGQNLAPSGASQVELDEKAGVPLTIIGDSGQSLPITVPTPTPSPALKKLAETRIDPTKPLPAGFLRK